MNLPAPTIAIWRSVFAIVAKMQSTEIKSQEGWTSHLDILYHPRPYIFPHHVGTGVETVINRACDA